MIDIINNKLSFVQFAKGNTAPMCAFVPPFVRNGELKFQVVMEGSEDDIDDLMDSSLNLYIISASLNVVNVASINTQKVSSHLSAFEANRISATKAVYSILQDVYDEDLANALPAIGKCIRFAIVADGMIDGEIPYWLSNTFVIGIESEYSSVLEYRCDENSFGFYYCDGQSNTIRLPLYLNKPQFKDESSIYFQSNGIAQIHKSVTRKEFQGSVDYVDADTHERIKIALDHDYTFLDGKRHTGGIRKNGDYDIQWPDMNDYDEAMASFKAYATPYLVKNDNCAECGNEFEAVPESCDIEISEVTLQPLEPGYQLSWQLLNGIPEGYYVSINGDDPLFTSASGITVDELQNGNNVISVTPVFIVNGQSVECITVVTNIEVDDCVPIAVPGTPSFANAMEGVPYNYTVLLNGSLPISLLNVVNPAAAWLSIATSGNSIVHSGTPPIGSAVNDLQISYEVHNCSEAFETINGEFDVVAAEQPDPTNPETCHQYLITCNDPLGCNVSWVYCNDHGGVQNIAYNGSISVCAKDDSINGNNLIIDQTGFC